MVTLTEIEPGLFASDSLGSALRCLLSTNKEPVLKVTLWFIWIYADRCSELLFTTGFLRENLFSLISPIALEKYALDYLKSEFETVPLTSEIDFEECFDGIQGTTKRIKICSLRLCSFRDA